MANEDDCNRTTIERDGEFLYVFSRYFAVRYGGKRIGERESGAHKRNDINQNENRTLVCRELETGRNKRWPVV